MQSQLKILFLDDHAGLRDSLGTFLSNKNPALQFYYAGNKDEALKILTENPDMKNAIVDINLNGINGLDLISTFRNQTPNLNVIVYSMFADVLHIEQALQNEEDTVSHVLYEHAGDICAMGGFTEKAIEYWKIALQRDPQNKAIQRKLKHKKYIRQ